MSLETHHVCGTEHYLPGALGGAARGYGRLLPDWITLVAPSRSAESTQQVVFSSAAVTPRWSAPRAPG
jgi:hypothetical protein